MLRCIRGGGPRVHGLFTIFLERRTVEIRSQRHTYFEIEKTHSFHRHFVWLMGGVRNISIFQFVHADTKTHGPVGPSRGREVSPDIQDNIQGKMPFYQVLCIAAHNPEYVRDEAFYIHTLPFIFAATATNQKPCPPSGHPHTQQRRRRSRITVLGHRDASSTHEITRNQS